MDRLSDGEIVGIFEALVEELERPSPDETLVKKLMEQLGMEYSCFPEERISKVLEKMNSIIFAKRVRKDKNDSPEYS